jgi:hypothetical protein
MDYTRQGRGLRRRRLGRFFNYKRELQLPLFRQLSRRRLAYGPSLDSTTRSWVYQALREITNEDLATTPTHLRTGSHAMGPNAARSSIKANTGLY